MQANEGDSLNHVET